MVTGGDGVGNVFTKYLARLVQELLGNGNYRVVVVHLRYQKGEKPEKYGIKYLLLEVSIDGIDCKIPFSTRWYRIERDLQSVFHWKIQWDRVDRDLQSVLNWAVWYVETRKVLVEEDRRERRERRERLKTYQDGMSRVGLAGTRC